MSSMDAANYVPRKAGLKRRVGVAVGAVTVVAVCVAIRSVRGPAPADAKDPPSTVASRAKAARRRPQQPLQIVGEREWRHNRPARARSGMPRQWHYGSEFWTRCSTNI